MRHFMTLFQAIQTIPVSILCEPLLKQIELTPPPLDFNIYDFEFFTAVVHHKRTPLAIALPILTAMINLATQNIFFANAAIALILEIVHRFSKDALLH